MKAARPVHDLFRYEVAVKVVGRADNLIVARHHFASRSEAVAYTQRLEGSGYFGELRDRRSAR